MPDESKNQVVPGAAGSDQSGGDDVDLGFGRTGSTDSDLTGDGPEAGDESGAAGSGKSEDAQGDGGKSGSTGPEAGQGQAAGRAEGGRPRDAQGRFVATTADQAGSGQTGAEKFVFLGQEFDNIAQAEHQWRSYFGSVKQWQDRHDALKRQYDELQARLDKQEQGPPPESHGPSADAKATAAQTGKDLGAFAELVDYDLLQEIYDDPSLGPKRAFQYMAMKVDEYLKGAREEWLKPPDPDPRLDRVFKDQEQQELFVETVQTFEQLQARRDSAGNALYPRLADADFASRVARLYLEDADLRSRGVYGAHLAYLDAENWERYMARDIKAHKPGAASTPVNGEAQAGAGAFANGPPKPSTAEPRDYVISGSDTPSLVTRGKPQDWIDREFNELEAYARSRGDGVLGF
jgi:hypothetical protein